MERRGGWILILLRECLSVQSVDRGRGKRETGVEVLRANSLEVFSFGSPAELSTSFTSIIDHHRRLLFFFRLISSRSGSFFIRGRSSIWACEVKLTSRRVLFSDITGSKPSSFASSEVSSLLLWPSSLPELNPPSSSHSLSVETVARSLYASTTRPNSKIFLDNPQARSLLFSLRIRISHFVNAFAGYTFDTAIGRNWRIFIRRLERLKTQSQSSRTFEERKDRPAMEHLEDEENNEEEEEMEMEEGEGGGGTELKDIFALVSYHGTVLDRISTSCFLGSDRESDLPSPLLVSRL